MNNANLEPIHHFNEESLYRNFFELAPVLMGVVEILGDDILHIADNPMTATYFGKTPAEMANKKASQLGVPKNIIDAWIKNYLLAEKLGSPVRFEHHQPGPPQSYFSVTVKYLGSVGKGRAQYSYIMQDITQQKESSKKDAEIERQNFRNLFMQTPEMVCILEGPFHTFQFVNEAHIRALGFDATGMTVRQAQPESVEVHGILDEVYRTGRTAELREIPVTLTDRIRYFNLTYAARKDDKGKIDGVMVLGIEVTEQVISRERLKNAVQARDEFLSIASHELRTPLTSLKLQNQIRSRNLKAGRLTTFESENLPQLLDSDDRQINRLIRLVDDMLDISRIGAGKLTYSKDEFDFGEMVQEIVSNLSPQIEKQGYKVSLDIKAPVVGNWDRFRIEQVVINLLTNALKYGSGKPISIGVKNLGDKVELTVKDNGLGIAAEDQERIFQQFERAVSSSSISGLGLGLFISKKIIEAHNGTVSVSSLYGEGSTFTVKLPKQS